MLPVIPINFAVRQFSILVSTFLRDRTIFRLSTILTGILFALFATIALAELLEDRAALAGTIKEAIGLGRDRSGAELFGYGLSFIGCVGFLMAFLDTRARIYLFGASLTSFLWLDDALQYHEKVGRQLRLRLELPVLRGLREQDTGELVAWALAGLVLLCVLVWSLRKRSPGDLGVIAAVLVAAPIFMVFGVIADMLHVMLGGKAGGISGLLEDGGEMIGLLFLSIIGIGISRNAATYGTACLATRARCSALCLNTPVYRGRLLR